MKLTTATLNQPMTIGGTFAGAKTLGTETPRHKEELELKDGIVFVTVIPKGGINPVSKTVGIPVQNFAYFVVA